MWCIISSLPFWLRQCTRWSWKIHEMGVWRTSWRWYQWISHTDTHTHAAEKSYEEAVAAVQAEVTEQYLSKVSIPVHHMAIFNHSAAEPDRYLNLPILGHVQAWSTSRRQCSKWNPVPALQWEKTQGRIPLSNQLHELYMVDNQDKKNPTDTDRLLLKCVNYKSFQLNSELWTFSSTVCVDSSWDDTGDGEDLVDITRQFKDLKGASKRPDARVLHEPS